MKNVYHKKICHTSAVQNHVETPSIPLIKHKNNLKEEKDCVETKLCRNPISENLYKYEFKMALFYNENPEDTNLESGA